MRFAAPLNVNHQQEFAEERKHVVRQHAAEVQELSDIIAAVEVRGPYNFLASLNWMELTHFLSYPDNEILVGVRNTPHLPTRLLPGLKPLVGL